MSVVSKALADYSKQFIISVVLGKDLVPRWDLVTCSQTQLDFICICESVAIFREPVSICTVQFHVTSSNRLCSCGFCRLSIPNMEDLKRRLLKMVSNCNKPKVRFSTEPQRDVTLRSLSSLITLSLSLSTRYWCAAAGTRCLEELLMISLRRWRTGGRRSWTSRCSARRVCWCGAQPPIRACRLTTRPPTPLTYPCSCPAASCTSLRTDPHAGLNGSIHFLWRVVYTASVRDGRI